MGSLGGGPLGGSPLGFGSSGFVEGVPKILLRIEGGAICALAVCAYARSGLGWPLFAVLFLAPDLSMLGYLANARIGAAAYNFAHTLSLPILLFGLGTFLDRPQMAGVALIWLAHIGLDRLLGFGLKYPTGFRDTHLGRLGGRPS